MISLKSARVWALSAVVGLLSGGLATESFSQSFPQPPAVSALDGNGVDLVQRTFDLPGSDIGIGSAGSALGTGLTGDKDAMLGGVTWDYMVVGPLAGQSVYFFRASYAGETHSFVMGTPGTGAVVFYTDWQTEMGGNAQLKCYTDDPTKVLTSNMSKTEPSHCKLRTADGTEVLYSNVMSSGAPWSAIDTVTKADGEVLKFDYYIKPATPPLYPFADIKSVRTVTSSLGWALKYTVDANYKVSGIVAVNSSSEYCPLGTGSCGSSSSLNVALATSGTTTTVSRNGVTQFTYSKSGGTTTITSPSGLIKTVVTSPTAYQGVAIDEVQSVTVGGQTWTYDWGSAGTSTVTAPNGSTKQMAAPVEIDSVTDEAGRMTSYVHSGATWGGRSFLLKAINPDATKSGTTLTGGYTEYTYSGGNLIKTTVVPKNGAPGGVIDPALAIVTSATFETTCDDTNFKYCHKPLTTTDANGVVTTYTYDAASGNVATVTLPPPASGGVAPQKRYTYVQVIPHIRNAGGTLDASPPVWRLSATSTCMTLASCSDASTTVDRLQTTYTYDTDHAMQASATVNHGNSITGTISSLTTAMTYNGNGDLIVTDGPQPGAIDENYTFYDTWRRPVGTISLDPDGTGALKRKAGKTSYDVDGRVTSVESGVAGNGLTAAYSGATAADRWTQASTDWAATTIQQKDTTSYSTTNGLPIISRHYDGAAVTYLSQTSYDNMFRKVCVVQRMNPAVFSTVTGTQPCTFGAEGNDGPDRIVKYSYDVLSNVVSTTSAFGTPLAQVDFLKSFSNSTGTTPNTASGTLAYVEDAKGNRTSYTYDNFNRLIKTCYPSKTTIHTSATTSPNIDCEQVAYRATTLAGTTQAGTLVSTTTLRDGQVNTFSYDNFGRVKAKAGPVSDAVTYDNFNQVKTHTQNGVTETYIYDTAGWLLSDAQGMGTVTYTYDAYGQRNRLTYPGTGLYVTYTYNTGGYLTAIQENGTTNLATYAYDDYSRPTTVSFGNGYSTAYTYDANSRLYTQNNTVSGGNNLITLSYSQADQIVSRVQSNAAYEKTSPAAGTTSLTHNGLNQMTVSGSFTLSYDARGNLSSDGAVTYSYDANNLMLEASTYHLRYDAENRLRVINSDTTTARQFLYDGSDLIAEYNSTGGVSRRYVHGPGTDNPIVWYEGAGTSTKYFFQADERGSITTLTNATGVTQARYSYDEFGVPQTNAGSLASPFRYTGQVWLPEVGLYYYKARMYAPSLGRFMQTDPIGYGDGMNLYAYVRNNPIKFSDSTGLACAYENHSVDSINGAGVVDHLFNYTRTYGDCGAGGGQNYVWDVNPGCRNGSLNCATGVGTDTNYHLDRPKSHNYKEKADKCTALQTEAEALSETFDYVSEQMGWAAFAGAGVLALSGAGEVPSGGTDTPLTVAAGSFTYYAGISSFITGGIGASLKSFSQGNSRALSKFTLVQLSSLSVGKIVEHLPGGEKFSDILEGSVEKTLGLVSSAKEAGCLN